MSAKKFDIFISYQWDISEKVLKLYEIIFEKITQKIWLDKKQILSGRILFEQLKDGIDNSHLVLCCLTKAYSLSKNCQDELSYALALNRPLLILMFERLDISKDIGWIGFKIAGTTRCNLYNDLQILDTRCGPIYDEIMNSTLSLLGSNQTVSTVSKPKLKSEPKVAIKVKSFNINVEHSLDYKQCSICNTKEECVKLWTKHYCENCWNFLSCSICDGSIDKENAFKSKDNQVICESCSN